MFEPAKIIDNEKIKLPPMAAHALLTGRDSKRIHWHLAGAFLIVSNRKLDHEKINWVNSTEIYPEGPYISPPSKAPTGNDIPEQMYEDLTKRYATLNTYLEDFGEEMPSHAEYFRDNIHQLSDTDTSIHIQRYVIFDFPGGIFRRIIDRTVVIYGFRMAMMHMRANNAILDDILGEAD